ncbi:MAG: type II toxin-antitoxin system RelE/ParE family toxin [Gammaproteobacteria bacterium]|nr:type II toxin-antitoxin system RelE/ParE family toxin [Gammaproteobacteria bacterium]MDE0511167.1 type II toxin-antitoxin system RelE/ParE family toxin [Gammaproteobacteria bacterium]
MSREIIEPQALSDIKEAAAWYETQCSGLGSEFVWEIDSAIKRVQDNPRFFPEVYRGVRRVLTKKFPYAIYYLLNEKEIRILAALHQSRSDITIASRLS